MRIKKLSSDIKTFSELREHLINAFQGVENGTISPSQANSMANVTGKMLTTFRVQIELYRFFGSKGTIDLFGKTLIPEKTRTKRSKKAEESD